MIEIALFYVIAAVVWGLFFASFETVTGEWRGKPMKHPRLWGGIIAAAVWPYVVVRYLSYCFRGQS